MWGKAPFEIADNFSVAVWNLGGAREWHKEKLGLREARTKREDDSGLPFVDLQIGSQDTFITLTEAEAGTSVSDVRPMVFSGNLEKAREWLVDHGVAVGPIESDSGGNRLFAFRDLDENTIEVCAEPG